MPSLQPSRRKTEFNSLTSRLVRGRPQPRPARHRRAFLESLEDRCVMAAEALIGPAQLATELVATLDLFGNLWIADQFPGGRENQLSISREDNKLVITDSTHPFTTAPLLGVLSQDGLTLTMPIELITGRLIIATGGGDDTLTVDLSAGDSIPLRGIDFDGGAQSTPTGDSLVILGGEQGTVTYNYFNAHDGDVVMSNFGTITYAGLEPITNSGTATDVIFNLPAATNNALLADDGTVSNGLSRLSGSTFETTDFTNPTSSLTINRGSASDTLNLNALPDFSASLTLGAAATPFASISFNSTVTLAANSNLAGYSSGSILLPNTSSDVSTTGTGTISLTAGRDITLSTSSSLITANGNLTLSANLQTPASTASHRGVLVSGAEVRTTGTGAVVVEGRGGAPAGGGSNFHGVQVTGSTARITSGGGNVRVTGFGGGATFAQLSVGVLVSGGAEISAGGTGTTTVQGTGGNLNGSGGSNVGVVVTDANSRITSTNAPITVTGTGGSSTGANNIGVSVELQGMIFAGGASSSTTVTGNGGGLGGGGSQNYGVGFGGGRVTSSGGNVFVNGFGGGAGSSFSGNGVFVSDGGITAVASGQVFVNGIGGNSSGTGGQNVGVRVFGSGPSAFITSAGGNVTITANGSGTTSSDNHGLRFDGGLISAVGSGVLQINATGANSSGSSNSGVYIFSSASLMTAANGGININATATSTAMTNAFEHFQSAVMNTTGTGNITIAADTMNIDAAISASSRTVTLKPRTAGKPIYLGTIDSQFNLGLTDTELDRVTAGTLNIGEFNLSAISVNAPISRPAATNVVLRSGDFLRFSGSSINTAGGTLQLNSSGAVGVGIRAGTVGLEAIASQTTLTTGSALEVNFLDATNYNTLNVAGTIILNSNPLIITGAYVPTTADTFTLIDNDGTDAISGTFSGLPENAAVMINGVQKRITYVGGTGNDVVLRTLNVAPVITSNGGGATANTTVLSGVSTVTTVTATDSDLPANTLNFSLTGGADQAKFTINSSTGALQFISPPNSSAPTDVGGNNIYDVIVQVSDGVGGTDTQSIAVTVTNLLALSGHRDLIYDPLRQQLLVTTSTGTILRYNEATNAFVSPLIVGQSLRGGDITADANFVYVTEDITSGGLGTLRKTNLNSGAVTNFTYTLDTQEAGGWDIAIADNGLGMFTTRFSGSGWNPLHQINTATDVITTAAHGEVRQDTHVWRSANRSTLFFQESNISSGPMFTYTSAGGFSASQNLDAFQDNSVAAVSPTGNAIAVRKNADLVVFDAAFNAITQFADLSGGVIFHPTQPLLLAVNVNTDQVIAYDTTTWQERYRVAIGEDVSYSQAFGAGVTAIGGGGNKLYLSTNAGIRVIDLPPNNGIAASASLSDYGTYVLAGAPVSVTVTMRDPSGAVATGYTGTVRFTSSDPAAVLPANYTFTPADAGRKTFTFSLGTAGNRTITATDTTTASITGTSGNILVHTAPTALLPVTGARDLVVDSLRNILYVTTSSGAVQRYSIGTDSLLSPYQLSQSLYGADTNASQSMLYVQDGIGNAAANQIHKVDLATGAVTAISVPRGSGEAAGWDLNIAGDDKAYITGQYAGSGWVPLRQVNLADGVVTTTTKGSVRQNTQISRSADRSQLFFLESNISSGPTFTYSVPGGFSTSRDAYVFHDGTMSAISPTGSLIAMELNGNIVVFTNTWQAVEQLANLSGGLIFHPTQNLLLAVDQNADQLVAFDTTTWQERYRLPIGENVGNSTPFGAGTTAISADGSKLFLTTATGVRIIALPAATGVTASIGLSNYSNYVNAGTPFSLTVTMRDPTGAIATGYTGTVQFTSSDPAAVLPANYTFSAADAGQKTFNITLNTSGNRTITLTDTSVATLTSTTSAIQVHATPTSLLPITGARDLVFDTLRNVLYVTTASGVVQRYHVGTDSLLAPWNVSDSLNAGDITATNGALYVQEGIRNLQQGMVRKIDLATGTFSNVTFDRSGLEGGGWDVAIAADGFAYLTSSFEGSGSVPLRRINVATDAVSIPTGRTSVNESTHITRGGDRSRLFFQEVDISSGPAFTYSVPGAFSSSVDSYVFHQSNIAAVNNDGSRIAMEMGTDVVIFDAAFNAIEQLGGYGGGIAFHPTQNLFLAINETTDQIVAFDTSTWKERYRVAIGENIGASTPLGSGVMTISAESSKLFLITGSGVRVITLPAPSGIAARLDISGYGSYLNAGTPATMTVTIRDPAGNIVPDYTGTVQFSSTDVGASLPPNYTFTPADGGTKTFTFSLGTAGVRTVTATDTLQPSLTSTTANITVHTALTSLIPITNARDLVYDSARRILYITTASGQLQRYGIAQDSLLSPFNVSHSLYGIDTTPGNGAIYAMEGIRNIADGMVRKIDPVTGNVTNVTFDSGSLQSFGYDLNIDANGVGFFTQGFAGSGWVPLRRLATATDTVTIAAPTHASVRQNTQIARNDTRTLLGFMESNISSGPIFTYSAATGTYPASVSTSRFLDAAFQAINSSGTFIAVSNTSSNNTEIYGPGLAAITSITTVRGGLAFKPGTNRLYVADHLTDTIRVYDGDNAWAFVESFPIGESIASMGNMGTGVLTFDAGGSRLFLITPSGVRMYVTGDITNPTASPTPANQTIPENGNTGALPFTVGDNVTAATDLVVSATSSNPMLIPNGNIVFGGSGANRTITVTPALHRYGGPATITVTVTDAALNPTQFTFNVTVTPTTFQVVNFTPTSTGYTLEFNRDLNLTPLNLYDTQGSGIGPIDLVLQPATVGLPPVRGTAIMDSSLRKLTFVATAGVLLPDNYTVTLRSALDGFSDAVTGLLDGDANLSAGGNFIFTFPIATPPSNALTISLPNFARGPQQPVNVPANATTGIPISMSGGAGLTSVRFNVRYNPALLSITGGTLAPGLPGGTAVTVNVSTPGIADINFTSSSPLPDNVTRFVDLQATVPATATYRQKNLLDISDIVLSDTRPFIDDDGVQVVAYFGDATANGAYSSLDSSFIARVAVALDGGFAPFKLVDPVIIADLSLNNAISSSDTSKSLQLGVGLPVPEVAVLPSPAVSLVQGGPDPKLSISQNLTAKPGEHLVIPVDIDSIVDLTGNGLQGADLVIYYDAASLDVSGATLGSLLTNAPGNWTIASHVDALAGRIIVSLAGTQPLEGFFLGELVQLQAKVKDNAPAGPIAINLAASSRDPSRFTGLNEGYLTLIPAPTDADNDAVDGIVTIVAAPAVPALSPQLRLIGDRLLVTGATSNDRIFISQLDDESIAFRINSTRPVRLPLPSAIAVDHFLEADQVVIASGLRDRVLRPSTSAELDLALLQWLNDAEAGEQASTNLPATVRRSNRG